MPLIEDYIELQQKYEKKYGDKTIVLYECGQFFEIYGVVNEEENFGKIYDISELTNLSVSKRSDKYAPVSRKNPLMAGFPNHSFEKWKDILLKHNYTVIKIEQDSHGTKDPERKITEIISPGINIDCTSFSNNLMSIYLEHIIDKSINKLLTYAGISIIDITTGDNSVYEIKSDKNDNDYVLEEIFRIVQTYNPNEIIINTENYSGTKEDIIKYLEIENRNIHYNNFEDNKYLLENKYKLDLLDKLFPKHNMLNSIEYIDLDKMYWGLCSYIYLLQFAYEHNESIIKKLIKPKIWDSNKYLILSYDSINQINVVPNKNLQIKSKYDSLWNLLDKTSTCLGKRLLKDNILNPIISIDELQKRYDLIETMLQNHSNENTNKIYLQLEKYLEKIFDIERMHRKMTVGMLNPGSFINLDISYSYIQNIIQLIQNINNTKLNSILPEKNIINQFYEFIDDYNKKLNMNAVNGCTLSNMKMSIFKKGIYSKIDELQIKIDNCYDFFDKLSEYISNKLSIDKSNIEIKYSEKEGHYYSTTKKRIELFKNSLKSESIIKLNDSNNSQVNINTIEYKNSTSVSKIFSPEIKSYSEKLSFYQEKMMKLSLEYFQELLYQYDIKYGDTLKNIVKFIAYIDFTKSNARTAFEYKYTKPTINNQFNNKSYIKSNNLRHPIIEKINTKLEYIPNDVDIGTNVNGILLYGVNAVGKSSYMKSIGLSIIMAQAGLYVPADTFEFYPYKKIFTRISGNDNIFKGQSTFAVEMSELRSIIKRADSNTLVLGDELCSGTETVSGLSIVAAGVITLQQKQCSFIFATHLHQLSSMNRLKELQNVKNYHMETIYDEENDKLIYNRKLKDGPGNAIYGLEVAKAMDLDKEFINLANNIRQEVLNIDDKIISKKTSIYNNSIIMDKCRICKIKDALETHHIKPQKIADEYNMIDTHHKNIEHNLIPLCHECHQSVENGDLEITGYHQTSQGREVKFRKINELETELKKDKKKKYNSEQIKIILGYRPDEKKKKNISLTKKLLEKNNNISVSTTIIKKIWDNIY